VLIKFFGEFFLSDTFRCWWDYFLMKLCFFGGIIFWAMPSARATPGSLPLGYCYAMNQALRIPIAIFVLGVY